MKLRWPWPRRDQNGAAQQAVRDAEEQHVKAREQTAQVERAARAAKEMKRRTDRFAREIERSWRPKESP